MMEEFLLGREWLETLVDRLDDQGWSEEQITNYANAWSSVVINYVCYLTVEGYSAKEAAKIVNSAVEQADFDLSRMPIVPGDPR
jgi:hypothetical protein